MSTIAAVVTGESGPGPRDLLERIVVASRSHESAAHGLLELDGCGLAASILPVTLEDQAERQPVHLAETDCYALLAGRLDNRAELLRRLQVADLAGTSDARLALLAFAKWGSECAGQLIGAFALIIWDDRNKKLFCATDHLATRQLYYAWSGSRLLVASSIRQLLADSGVDHELDDDFMRASLTIPSVAPLLSDRTPYRGIRRLPPGSDLSSSRGAPPAIRRYWRPEELDTYRTNTDAELAEQLRDVFETAVRAQLRSSRTVLATLSGGIDSSSIACTAAIVAARGELPCPSFGAFHFTYDEARSIDESKYRNLVTEQYGLHSTKVRSKTWMFRGMFDDTRSPVPDEPFAAITAQHLYTEAASHVAGAGGNVVLYGVGGDELMSGNENYLADLLLGRKLGDFARGVRELGRLPNRTHLSTALLSGVAPVFRNRMIARALVRGAEGRQARPEAWWLYGWPSWVIASKHARAGVREVLATLPERPITPPGRAQCAESLFRNLAISQWNDCVFGPAGVEMRSPFYDRRVVELSLSIPEERKLRVYKHRFLGKLVFRRAMSGILPDGLRDRKGKAKFDALAHVGAEREAPDLARSKTFQVVERGYVDEESLRNALRSWRVGQWEDLPRLSLLFSVEAWLRRHGSDGTRIPR